MINFNFPLLNIASNNVWQSMAILAVVMTIFKIIKNTSAEERSWSWNATLFAVALLPMAAFLPGEGVSLVTADTNREPIVVEQLAPVVPNVALKELPLDVVTLPRYSKSNLITLFIGFWILGIGVALTKLMVSGVNAYKIRGSSYPYVIDGDWNDTTEIVVSDEISGPIVIGYIKPIIVLPVSFAKSMTFKQIEPLLLHELAHIKRHDNIFYLIERIVLSLYWWNPVMHYIGSRVAEERELACDDRAALKSGDQVGYAKSLLNGARHLVGQNKSVLGVAALRRESVLSKRVKRMTDYSLFKGFNSSRFGKNITVLMLSVFMLGLVTPRIDVSFAQSNDASVQVEALLDNGGTAEVLSNMEDLNDSEIPAYTDALLERKELRSEEYKKLSKIIGQIKEEHVRGEAAEHLMDREDQMDDNTRKVVVLNILGNEEVAKIRANIQESIRTLPKKINVEKMRKDIQNSIKNLPTEKMAEEMRRNIKENLKNLPTKEILADVRADVEKALSEIPANMNEDVDVEAIIAEVEASLQNIKIDINVEKIIADVEQSLEDIPTEEEIEEMRKDLQHSLEV
ncbi:MAG: M56 family metallopeptidase, partial [Emcibacteraceae bacterium]|nr:M56 family metallopeptidase [Emcibacteraceae bacterium]